ncbi:MAG: DUF488 domain-containing protein [Dehalococcoidia bacterium]|nr:DUF488 domain-containing protein [Dehalococcoidia bacterium]
MEIATIGFTHSSAEHFFERLSAAGVQRILDVRLHNVSQLAGFAKASDLAYFARVICGAGYEHDLRLAPTEELLSPYRKDKKTWPRYESGFLELMRSRDIPAALDPGDFHRKTVLLCSEPTADTCHRRLVAELVAEAWSAKVEHL